MVTQELFGTTRGGVPVYRFCIENASGASVSVMNYGCTIQAIRVPDRNGTLTDVCLGYRTLAEYEQNNGYLGAVVGRHGNRIEKGIFQLNGTEYHLAVNDGPNHLHGGICGFDKRVWDASIEGQSVMFHRLSPDGEEGYPGNLDVRVTYTFTDDNRLLLQYRAETDADTVVNLTNHCYFNLSGEGKGTIRNHILRIPAGSFTENDADCLPTGTSLPWPPPPGASGCPQSPAAVPGPLHSPPTGECAPHWGRWRLEYSRRRAPGADRPPGFRRGNG